MTRQSNFHISHFEWNILFAILQYNLKFIILFLEVLHYVKNVPCLKADVK